MSFAKSNKALEKARVLKVRASNLYLLVLVSLTLQDLYNNYAYSSNIKVSPTFWGEINRVLPTYRYTKCSS